MTGVVQQEDARVVDKPGDVRQVGLGAGGQDCHDWYTPLGLVEQNWSVVNYRRGQWWKYQSK